MRARTLFARDVATVALLALISLSLAKVVNAIHPAIIAAQEKQKSGELLEPSALRSIDLAQLLLLMNKPTTALLDARPSGFFEMGHLPGAINLPRRDLDEAVTADSRLREINRLLARRGVKRLVVYCSGAECTDSDAVARRLIAAGWNSEQVEVYTGGWEEWEAGGRPVEKDE